MSRRKEDVVSDEHALRWKWLLRALAPSSLELTPKHHLWEGEGTAELFCVRALSSTCFLVATLESCSHINERCDPAYQQGDLHLIV